ncbi:MAG: DinB family protein [Acidobacteriota bacterium]
MANPIPASGPALAELLRKGHSSNPWHGPATADLLAGVSPSMAVAKPVADGHSVWEIVLHMTGWQREVARRLGGATPGLPDEGDWPVPPEATQEAWDQAKAALRESLEELAGAVAGLSEQDLETRIGTSSRPLGTGVTRAETVIGMLQHNAYHSGQIALLLKALQ